MAFATALSVVGCDDNRPSPPAPDAARAVRVASLVPSATDLLIGAGLSDHLVAVSNYCRANPQASDIPTAGDYQTVDWERLAEVRPDIMLVFMSADRIPDGMRQRASALGILIEVIKVETVADVVQSITALGDLVGEPAKALAARQKLEARLQTVRDRSAGRSKVRTLIVVGDSARGVIGPGGFLDELLTLAGGENAAAGLGTAYPSVDDEKIAAMDPERIIHLLPGATPEQVEQARQSWLRRDGLRASRDVAILTDWWLLQPGYRIGDTAEQIQAALYRPPARGTP